MDKDKYTLNYERTEAVKQEKQKEGLDLNEALDRHKYILDYYRNNIERFNPNASYLIGMKLGFLDNLESKETILSHLNLLEDIAEKVAGKEDLLNLIKSNLHLQN